MPTTIGEVNINLRMNLAEFKKDVKDGAAASSRATKQIADEARENSQEAKASLALIGEEIGVTIPRHVRGLIAALPGVGTALSAAFNSIAIVTIIGVIAEMIDKLQELGKQEEKIEKAWNEVGAVGEKALAGLNEESLTLQIQLDKLANDNLAALRDQLKLIDAQSLKNLTEQFESLQKAADKAFDEMEQGWLKSIVTFGDNSFAKTFGQTLEEIFAPLTPTNKSNEALKNLKEGFDELVGQVIRLKQAGDTVGASNALADNIAKIQAALSKPIRNDAIREALERELGALQQMNSVYQAINKNADTKKQIAEITEATDSLQGQLETLKGLSDATHHVTMQNEDRFTREMDETERLIQRWKEYAEELDRAGINSGSAGAAIQALTTHLNDLQGMAQRAVDKLMGLSDESRKLVQDFVSSAALTKNIKLPVLGDTAQEQDFHEALTRLNGDMAEGRLSAAQYANAVQQLRFQFGQGGAATGVKEFFQAFQQGGQLAGQVFDMLQQGMDGFTQNVAEMLATGKANWADYFASIEEMILKSSLQTLLKQALGFLNNSDFFSGLGGGNFFGSGGIFGAGHASGGPVDAGVIYPVGEHGMEYFRPSVPGQILTQDQLNASGKGAKGGGVVNNFAVTVNGVKDVDSFKKSMPQVRAELFRAAGQAHGRNSR